MSTLADLASRYRWELMLLVGIPFIERMIRWLLPHILGNFDLSLEYWSCPPDYYCLPSYVSPFLNTSLYLLGFFYFYVRRTDRTTLTLLWAFVFVSEAVTAAVYLPGSIVDFEQTRELWWAWWSGANWPQEWWKTFLTDLPQMMVWLWFARRASRIGFNHALVFIGVAIVFNSTPQYLVHLVFRLLEDPAVVWWDLAVLAVAVTLFAAWVLMRLDVPMEKHEGDIERWIGSWDISTDGAKLRSLALRVLPRFDPARGISKELLVALLGLNLLLYAYPELRIGIGQGFMTMVLIAYRPLWMFIVILLAYAVRVDETTEPTAKPTKPFLYPSYHSQEKPPTS